MLSLKPGKCLRNPQKFTDFLYFFTDFKYIYKHFEFLYTLDKKVGQDAFISISDNALNF